PNTAALSDEPRATRTIPCTGSGMERRTRSTMSVCEARRPLRTAGCSPISASMLRPKASESGDPPTVSLPEFDVSLLPAGDVGAGPHRQGRALLLGEPCHRDEDQVPQVGAADTGQGRDVAGRGGPERVSVGGGRVQDVVGHLVELLVGPKGRPRHVL